MLKETIIGPDHRLTPEKVAAVAFNPNIVVKISSLAETKVKIARSAVERMVAEKRIAYGITTGFGSFKNKTISPEDTAELQRNLIRSHSVGVGQFLPAELVRASFLVRLNSLIQGHSGIRFELAELIRDVLNKNIIPAVPSQGSVGSSGDLAPLSHMGLVLMGEGQAWFEGELLSGDEALRRAGLEPIKFAAKEGLAFNNGTSVMTGIAAIAVIQAKQLASAADMACAISLESLCGISTAFSHRVHHLRPHPGQIKSAENIRFFVSDSRLVDSIKGRVQDAYSLRCAPQVHGAARDTLAYVQSVVERELNSVTDNPLIFPEEDLVVSGGNFHGEPIAIAMDALGIAISEIANISERRIARLINSDTNEGLPIFLIPKEKGGLHSGLMMPQYTAAALVSENKVLAHPASVDSIPTSCNQEDHVSMGTIAARKCIEILKNSQNVLAIEFLTATQAVEFRGPENMGKLTGLAYKLVRSVVDKIENDRQFSEDIKKIKELLFSFNSARFE